MLSGSVCSQHLKPGIINHRIGGNSIKGAVVFLVVFIAFIFITLAIPSLPPGGWIYDALNVPDTDYPVLGIGATKLRIAIFNGAVFGVIAWLAYSLTLGRKKPVVKADDQKPST